MGSRIKQGVTQSAKDTDMSEKSRRARLATVMTSLTTIDEKKKKDIFVMRAKCRRQIVFPQSAASIRVAPPRRETDGSMLKSATLK